MVATALWSGLSWMGNLRMGVTALWKRPILAENFVLGKLRDFIRLLGMMLMMSAGTLIVAYLGLELLALSGMVASRLRADGYRARTAVLKVRLANFTTLTRSQLVRWHIAICAIFLASGLSISTWAPSSWRVRSPIQTKWPLVT